MTGEEYAKRVVEVYGLPTTAEQFTNLLAASYNFGQAAGIQEGGKALDRLTARLKLSTIEASQDVQAQ